MAAVERRLLAGTAVPYGSTSLFNANDRAPYAIDNQPRLAVPDVCPATLDDLLTEP